MIAVADESKLTSEEDDIFIYNEKGEQIATSFTLRQQLKKAEGATNRSLSATILFGKWILAFLAIPPHVDKVYLDNTICVEHNCENGIDESGMGKCMDDFPPSPPYINGIHEPSSILAVG